MFSSNSQYFLFLHVFCRNPEIPAESTRIPEIPAESAGINWNSGIPPESTGINWNLHEFGGIYYKRYNITFGNYLCKGLTSFSKLFSYVFIN